MHMLLSFLLVALALLSYVVLSVGFGIEQRYPLVHMALAALGLVFMALLLRQRITRLRVAAVGLAVLLFSGFLWWTLDYSEYERNVQLASGPLAGLNAIQLEDHEGRSLNFGELIAQEPTPTLLVFYRGHW